MQLRKLKTMKRYLDRIRHINSIKMNGYLLLLCCSLLVFLGRCSSAPENVPENEFMKTGDLVACGDDKVVILDGDSAKKNVVSYKWRWQVSEAQDQLPDGYFKLLSTLDDCKPIAHNSKLLITASSGASLLLEIASKKVVWYAKTPMAHSAEILPGERIAVVNSTHPKGNSLELYDSRQAEQVLFKDSLYSGHGVVWNEQLKELIVLNYDELRAYELHNWEGEHPKLVRKKTFHLPSKGGHELTPVDENYCLVSAHDNVWLVDLRKGVFNPFPPLNDKKNIKSANYNLTTKALVYTIAEESWWTYHIYGENPDFKLYIPEIKLYKVRVGK